MSDKDAVGIFNNHYFGRDSPLPGPASTSGASSFRRFADLPPELRLKIWTWHLHQRRFIRILLGERDSPEEEHESETPAGSCADYHHEGGGGDDDDGGWGAFSPAAPVEPPEEDSGRLKITFLDDPTTPRVPALPRVCREAREAFTSFYRIRIPAALRVPSGLPSDATFATRHIVAYLHPDLDILSLQTADPPAALVMLPLFLHALCQHDSSPASRRYGARNLCIDLAHLGSDRISYVDGHDDDRDYSLAPPLPPDVLSSVRLSVSHLRSLYLRLTTSHSEPRVTTGPLNGSRALPWYNASMPILPDSLWGFSGAVERVDGGDPRLSVPEGAADLHQVWTGNQIRPSLEVWDQLERAWGARAGAEVAGGARIRALVALDAHSSSSGRGRYSASLEAAMRREHGEWLRLLDPAAMHGPFHRGLFENALRKFLPAGAEASAPEEWVRRRWPHTAVGFWLVDTAALAAAPTQGLPGKWVADLSGAGRQAIELWALEASEDQG